jgi:hypothetical protein
MDQVMIQIVVCCIIFSVFAHWLAVYVKNSVARIFPGFVKNNMLGSGTELLIFDKSIPRSVQNLYLTSRVVFLMATGCGLVSAWYFNNHGWIKIFLVPTAYAVYDVVVCMYRFIKCKWRQV